MLVHDIVSSIRFGTLHQKNKNADGKVDAKDVQVWWEKSQAILKNSVPEAGGFSAGFLLGARRG